LYTHPPKVGVFQCFQQAANAEKLMELSTTDLL
jgi:hypothetical protein